MAYKFFCLVTTGWIGLGKAKEFSEDIDGRGDYIIDLFKQLDQNGIKLSFNFLEALTTNLPKFELHIEVQLPRLIGVPRYCLLLEDPHIRPQNFFLNEYIYSRVFTWDYDLSLKIKNSLLFQLPVNIANLKYFNYKKRDKFACMFASNKGQAISSKDDLYFERFKVINWYENYFPKYFDLYGANWSQPRHKNGLIFKFLFKLKINITNREKVKLKVYRGFASNKYERLREYKFNFCFENRKNKPGYTSEKIYDSMMCGTIPIYWGDPHIYKFVPKGCFIDYTEFKSNSELFNYLTSLTEKDIKTFRDNHLAFFQNQGELVSNEYFSKNVSHSIIDDICHRR